MICNRGVGGKKGLENIAHRIGDTVVWIVGSASYPLELDKYSSDGENSFCEWQGLYASWVLQNCDVRKKIKEML